MSSKSNSPSPKRDSRRSNSPSPKRDSRRTLKYIPFDGTNYPIWAKRTRILLSPEHRHFLDTKVEDPSKLNSQARILRAEAYQSVLLAMPDNLFHLVENTGDDDAHTAWQNVKAKFISGTTMGKYALRVKMMTLDYNSFESLGAMSAEMI